MMLVCVALTRGRDKASSLPTVPGVEQPRAVIPLKEVTPSLLFSRKFTKQFEILNPLKLKLGKKGVYGEQLVQDTQGVRALGSDSDVLLRKRACCAVCPHSINFDWR